MNVLSRNLGMLALAGALGLGTVACDLGSSSSGRSSKDRDDDDGTGSKKGKKGKSSEALSAKGVEKILKKEGWEITSRYSNDTDFPGIGLSDIEIMNDEYDGLVTLLDFSEEKDRIVAHRREGDRVLVVSTEGTKRAHKLMDKLVDRLDSKLSRVDGDAIAKALKKEGWTVDDVYDDGDELPGVELTEVLGYDEDAEIECDIYLLDFSEAVAGTGDAHASLEDDRVVLVEVYDAARESKKLLKAIDG